MHHISLVIFVALLVGTQAQHDTEKTVLAHAKPPASPKLVPRDTLKEKGQQIYFSNCNTCHKDSVTNIAPGLTIMRGMSTRSIVAALSNGKMRAQGAPLSP